MTITPTAIPDVLLVESRVFEDARGRFSETFNARAFQSASGLTPSFVQDNYSLSRQHVVRGLHYQVRHAQGKLVRVASGEIFDVCVDLRRGSPTFKQWLGLTLSAENARQLWIPEGFAHGFLVLSEKAEVLYKTTDYYSPEDERTLLWNDPALGIDWPITGDVILSPKDAAGTPLRDADIYA